MYSTPPDEPLLPAYDPREIVTEYAFSIDEQLLGKELATPTRRLAAILIDLVLASLLTNLGLLIGVAVAVMFFRVATRSQITHPLKRWARGSMALLGALILFGTVVAVVDRDDDGDGVDINVEAPMSAAAVSGRPAEAEPTSTDEAPAADEADQEVQADLEEVLEESGIDVDHVSGLYGFLAEVLNADDVSFTPEERVAGASRLRLYADALERNDQAALDTLSADARVLVAGEQLNNYRQRLRHADDRIDDLEDEAGALQEQVDNPTFGHSARALANDLGLTFGWMGVYFTLFLAWWRGQTPGKRLLGLQVVRLNGKPISLWYSFERFGGYAAGIFTGLLGFAQIYWDPNRQALHDRIAGTVVIRKR